MVRAYRSDEDFQVFGRGVSEVVVSCLVVILVVVFLGGIL